MEAKIMTTFESSGRSMRWYDWLAGLLLLSLACGVRAAPIYKCTDGGGDIAYQDHACAPLQDGREIELPAPPPPTSSPTYAVHDVIPARASSAARTSAARARRTPISANEISYECRVTNGDVFYRHSPCPHTIAASADSRTGKTGSKTARDSGGKLTVSSRPVSRDEACAQLHRAGAIGRNGHEHDETISTYERNLGHDPCH
jgi:hypothetical protein